MASPVGGRGRTVCESAGQPGFARPPDQEISGTRFPVVFKLRSRTDGATRQVSSPGGGAGRAGGHREEVESASCWGATRVQAGALKACWKQRASVAPHFAGPPSASSGRPLSPYPESAGPMGVPAGPRAGNPGGPCGLAAAGTT